MKLPAFFSGLPHFAHLSFRFRPYYAIALFAVDVHEKHDFYEAYFCDLMADKGSVLFHELRQNQNTSSQEGYCFPERNRLLHFLFSDALNAEKISVWKPVGDYVLKTLRSDEGQEYLAYLNGCPEGFEDERWNDSTFAAIFFFDLMVTAAAHQGIEWHMWLYYFPLFVDRLVDTYDDSAPSVSKSDEFPTRGARLLYEVISTLRSWVLIIKDLPDESPHRKIEPGFRSDNGNIPVSAAVALGSCMVSIAMSDHIDLKFSTYMHEVILNGIRDLSRHGVEGQMRELLVHSLVKGGQQNPDAEYRKRLETLVSRTDHVLRDQVRDYIAALRQAAT